MKTMTAVSSTTSTRSKVGTALVAVAALAGIGGLSFAIVRLVINDQLFSVVEPFTQSSLEDFDNPSESTFSLTNADTTLAVKDDYLFLKTLAGYGTEDALSSGKSPFRSNMSASDNFLRDPAEAVTICGASEQASIDSVEVGLFPGPEFEENHPDLIEADGRNILVSLPPLHAEMFDNWEESNPLLDSTPGGRNWRGHFIWWETLDANGNQTMSYDGRHLDAAGNPIYDRRVAFTSSNPEVAIVYPNGAIFPISPGETRIAVNVCGQVSPEFVDVVVMSMDVGSSYVELGGNDFTPVTSTRSMDTRFIMGRLISNDLFQGNIEVPEGEVIQSVSIAANSLAEADIVGFGNARAPEDYDMFNADGTVNGFIRLYASANGGETWSLPIDITPNGITRIANSQTIEFAVEDQGTELLYAVELVHDHRSSRILTAQSEAEPATHVAETTTSTPRSANFAHAFENLFSTLRASFSPSIAQAREVLTYFNSAATRNEAWSRTSILPLYVLEEHAEIEGFPNIASIPDHAGIFTAQLHETPLVSIAGLGRRIGVNVVQSQTVQLVNPDANSNQGTFSFFSDDSISSAADQSLVDVREFSQIEEFGPDWTQHIAIPLPTMSIIGSEVGFGTITCANVPPNNPCPEYTKTSQVPDSGDLIDTVEALPNRIVATLPHPSVQLSHLDFTISTGSSEIVGNEVPQPGGVQVPDDNQNPIAPGPAIPGGGVLPPAPGGNALPTPDAANIPTCAEKQAAQGQAGVPEERRVVCLNPNDYADVEITSLEIEDRSQYNAYYAYRGVAGGQRVVVPIDVEDNAFKQLLLNNAITNRAFGDITLLYKRASTNEWKEAPVYPNPTALSEGELVLTAALTDLDEGLRWNSNNGTDMENGRVEYHLSLHLPSQPNAFTTDSLRSFNRLQIIAYNYTLLYNDSRPGQVLRADIQVGAINTARYEAWQQLTQQPFVLDPAQPNAQINLPGRAEGILFFNGAQNADPNTLGSDITLQTLKFAQMLDRRYQEFPQLLNTIQAEQGTEAAVKHIYKSVLDRIYPGEYVYEKICDAEGCAYWTDQIESGTLTPMGVTGAFLKSPEFIAPIRAAAPDPQRFDVEYLYVLMLKRGADGAGVDWLLQTYGADPNPLASIRRHILLDAEFNNRIATVEEQSGRQAAVEELYDACAEGPADRAGIEFWSQQPVSLEELRNTICAQYL